MKYPAKAILAILCLLLLSYPAFPQTPTQPEREQLLNGLRLLFWLKPGSPEVILKLRINSGSAFDLAGKSGEMARVSGTYELTKNDASGKPINDRGKYLEVWEKQTDGNWKCAADMWNSDVATSAP